MYINSWRVKLILIGTILFYGIGMVIFLARNSSSNRFIIIESSKQGGVVLINNIKYKTPYIKHLARIVYKTDNLADYLFLNSDTQQDCYTTALLELSIVALLAIFLWRFDFYSPFNAAYLKPLKLIFGLITLDILLKWFANIYTASWVGQHLNTYNINDERYSYQPDGSNNIIVSTVIITVMLYLYSKAVKNQEEVELTV